MGSEQKLEGSGLWDVTRYPRMFSLHACIILICFFVASLCFCFLFLVCLLLSRMHSEGFPLVWGSGGVALSRVLWICACLNSKILREVRACQRGPCASFCNFAVEVFIVLILILTVLWRVWYSAGRSQGNCWISATL